MASEKLTALKVAKTKARGLYGDGRNLYLRIARGGSKTWVFRYMVDGRAREMGLGPLNDVTLAKARDDARKARQQIRDDIDPIEARRAKRAALQVERAKAVTFRECAEAYIAAHRGEWSNAKHVHQWNKTFLLEAPYVPAAITALPVAAIDEAIVMKILRPLWEATPVTASRVRGRVEVVLDWATASKFRASGPNPARWKGHLEHLLAKAEKQNKHLAALPFEEIPDFMAELRRQSGVGARALEFAILTAARTGEVLGAQWDEMDLPAKLWVIPAERMKAEKEHRVPLSDRAIAIVEEMRAAQRRGDLVFPGAKGRGRLSHEVMLRVLREIGRRNVTAHGFRSSFRDWAGDRTNFPRDVAEAALAHAVGNKVEAAYRRGSAFAKRRQLMAAWARFAGAAQTGGEIVRLVAV
jgi:integrase